jgi:hypothetical protein
MARRRGDERSFSDHVSREGSDKMLTGVVDVRGGNEKKFWTTQLGRRKSVLMWFVFITMIFFLIKINFL